MLTLDEASNDKVIINNGGNDIDFQVEGENDANLVSEQMPQMIWVGIGTDLQLFLDVAGTGSFNTVRWADGTTQATSATGDISIQCRWFDGY